MENSAAWIDSGYREKLNDVRKNSRFEQKDSEIQQNIVGKVTVVVNKYLTVFKYFDGFYQHFFICDDKITPSASF